MQRGQVNFLYLNLGHFLDHLFMLIFASVAALRLNVEWGMSYAELIPYATPGFVAFGICAIVAGWIADKWSRAGMIAWRWCWGRRDCSRMYLLTRTFGSCSSRQKSGAAARGP